MPESMERFIGEVREIVRAGGTEEEMTARVAERLGKVLDDPELLTEAQLLVKKEGFTLNCVHIEQDDSFSIGAGIWDVGQTTPVHDHGTWGVIGIVRGVEKEESFHREGPRLMEGRAVIKPAGSRLAKPGDVFVCCTTDQDAHRVTCASDEPVVGIHVYGDDLAKIPRLKYDIDTGEVTSFQTGWDYASMSA
ncbi:MAG: cysteine dioxygenase family protein [Nitrospinaceae bacterium]|jgi:3-mercaptopropionate dioxygenase|nr:cysteine dioxygenase family protein [Nitrospinaceae bacterium]MBT3432640.1 cysteine dioxygenase family protein [Nitrospinaceae bacterium]MBT3820629.1 cysteine dioxygenase family protein [Nitrospinaceae bacterium]MBT4094219.1 cysteine dioxygenase family protein [Nitrospinaceae bacterium]MBT4431097.1 cysteine dioxygenase family protein [Nitrospinaceae bacterium]